jgi:pimeloyl-ACP methyl ester carboxylesterase
VTIPTRLVFGDTDTYFCLDTAKASANFVNGPYAFIDVPSVGHWVPEESPEEVTNAILDVIRAAPDGG